MVVVMHQGGYERHDNGAMIVAAMDYMPDGVENVAGCADVGLVCLKLEVAYLTIESRRHLSLCERHGKVGEEGKAEDAEVIGKADGVDVPSSPLKKMLSLICDRWGSRMSRMRERSIS